MASLEFCSEHNMVAYLEKTDGNTEFHQIMDFLARSSIYYALTVSPIVSTSFAEQFWTSAKSRIVNNISYIDATVAGKPVTISEASIRSGLLFDDVDGIDSLNNQAIFDNIQLMGNQLKDVPVSLDHFPVPTLTKKVLTFVVKKGKNFSGKVTPLFDFMLVQQTEDEGDTLERPCDSQPIPSPPHPSADQPQTQTDPSPSIAVPNSNPEGSGGNHEGQSSNDASLLGNEDGLTLQCVYNLCVSLCKQTRLARKTSLKKKGVHKEYVSKQRRKSIKFFKGEPSVHKDLAFDDLDDFVDVDDTLDYMETKDAQDEGKTSSLVAEEKESADKEVSIEAPVSTVKTNEGTDKRSEGTDKQDRSTDSSKVSTDKQSEGTANQNEGKSASQIAPTTTLTPTPTIFGDDETISQVLITMSQNKQKEKEKGIDLKDKGKKRIKEKDESDTESEGIAEAEKKFKQLANDEEVARKVQEEWEAEEEKKRLAKEEATKEEREKFTIEQRETFLHDTIAAQTKFLAQQRSEAIRNKPPTRNQLRNQMMTYLKHVGGKKHSELKTKTFEEIQIEELNKDPEKKRLNKRVVNETPREEDTTKVLAEQDVTKQGTKKRKSGHVKMIARKRPRPQPDDDSDDEHRKCLRIVTFEGTIDSEIMETKSYIARLHKVSSPDGNYLVVYKVNGHFRAFNYLIEIMMESSTKENDQELKDEIVIYMLVERRYPLSKELLQQMIDLGLEVKEESTIAIQLGSQLTLLHSKELASPRSNSSWLSIYLVVYNEELAIPEQMATGKGISNPLMAGSLPKTTKPT
ncbi:hypothetical protein Tco_1052288 [Tanacetum coccineum]